MPADTPPRRPRSNVAIGAYYKARARKWLTEQGYQVADLEVVRWVGKPDTAGTRIPIKRDQFGSDLLAVSATEIVFAQIKGGRTAKSGVSTARREFQKFTFPPSAKRWIIVWEFRAREPLIIDCSEDETSEAPCKAASSTSARTTAF